jgi:hypothetical protein
MCRHGLTPRCMASRRLQACRETPSTAVRRSASNPRPLDPLRPYFGGHSRRLRIAAVCRDFVPVRQRPLTPVAPSPFHGKEGVVEFESDRGLSRFSREFVRRNGGVRACARQSRVRFASRSRRSRRVGRTPNPLCSRVIGALWCRPRPLLCECPVVDGRDARPGGERTDAIQCLACERRA